MVMRDIFKVKTNPAACGENIVLGDCYRISVLTDGLIRLEYQENGHFEDRPSQMAWNRDFKPTRYRVIKTEDGIEILTKRIHLIYDEKKFSKNGLSIQVIGNLSAYHSIWHYSEEIHDLKGTARTLDEVDGSTELEHGVLSRFGYSVLDDGKSMLLTEDGWVEPRCGGGEDIYFFGYGHDYLECLKDFYYLSGRSPMLPRFALGNWWSRYYKYTEESYLALMDRFEREDIPFTVAVIDMDWHLVDIDPKYGSGWTGYTWNRSLFPDPKRFLQTLHKRGMRTTLNVHPAEGVRGFEEMYPDMARALGVDWEKEDPINFDIADPAFLEAYLEYAHHPYEEMGVDFWWVDWQQGNNSKIPGLDPLWMLNHYHFLDSKREGKRPMTFSRYAGPGSHRYPVGFSGDTITTWESLDFQPYFTANASNIGYGWWSHDIGGHMRGYKDDEMEARWAQFGVFSPIMRLHSSSSEFNGKEPWRYKKEAEMVMNHMLRERHRMIPYLYTMNYRSYCENKPLISPMYYNWPECNEAYEKKNQYLFGTSLMVAPITAPRIEKINMAKVQAWLPKGRWYDIYTGMIYDGDRILDLYRGIESIPVFASAGSILAFTDEISAVQAQKNPNSLHLMVYAGQNGEFELYEDDNVSCAYEERICCTTKMVYCEDEKPIFTIYPSAGNRDLIPQKRSYTVEMTGFENSGETVVVRKNGVGTDAQISYDRWKKAIVVEIPETETDAMIEVSLEHTASGARNDVVERCFDFLNQAEIEFVQKDRLYELIRSERPAAGILSELFAMDISRDLRGVLVEILTAQIV